MSLTTTLRRAGGSQSVQVNDAAKTPRTSGTVDIAEIRHGVRTPVATSAPLGSTVLTTPNPVPAIVTINVASVEPATTSVQTAHSITIAAPNNAAVNNRYNAALRGQNLSVLIQRNVRAGEPHRHEQHAAGRQCE